MGTGSYVVLLVFLCVARTCRVELGESRWRTSPPVLVWSSPFISIKDIAASVAPCFKRVCAFEGI